MTNDELNKLIEKADKKINKQFYLYAGIISLLSLMTGLTTSYVEVIIVIKNDNYEWMFSVCILLLSIFIALLIKINKD